MLLLHSHTASNDCHITTANLDGETNLKKKTVASQLPPLSNETELSSFRGVIQSDKPNLNLYEFNGKLFFDNKEM